MEYSTTPAEQNRCLRLKLKKHGICVAVKVRKTIDILFEKCYSITRFTRFTRFCENPLKVEDDWIKDYAMEEGTYDITAVD